MEQHRTLDVGTVVVDPHGHLGSGRPGTVLDVCGPEADNPLYLIDWDECGVDEGRPWVYASWLEETERDPCEACDCCTFDCPQWC